MAKENKIQITIEELLESLKESYSQNDIDNLKRAYEFSKNAHEGQMRRSGEPYITHPVGVTSILSSLNLDYATLATGLLHDTVEDTEVTLEDIEKNFGEVVAHLVDGVTKISQMTFKHTHEKQGENIRKMIVAMGKDVRVVLVKLADRLHNMRTLTHMPYDKQKVKARETLDIYAPLAGRLGMSSIKTELEDLGFRYCEPERFYELVQQVDQKKTEREQYIEDAKKQLQEQIASKVNFEFDVSGRPKHLFSIYKKMISRNVDYDQVYDVLAFRIIVNTVPQCYEALGIVHTLFKPIPGRFKDFVAMAKTNNYQSLHTTLIGPKGKRIEVQIRTSEMHKIAELGIAAHWRYKEESRGGSSVNDEAVGKFNWLRDLVSLHQQTEGSDEFLETVKKDLLDSEIYIFTPKGDVKEFPEGATPIDFAYSVHTDLGSKVVAARINGRMVPLKYKMQNGDTVEVLTSKTQKPSKDWLKFCVTGKAKSKIRTFVKSEQRQKAMEIGKDLLERYFRKEGASLSRFTGTTEFKEYLKSQGCGSIEELHVLVGYGKLTSKIVFKEVAQVEEPEQPSAASFIENAVKTVTQKLKPKGSLVKVGGMDDLLVNFGKCCKPIPGDSIMGYISRGRGIIIHQAECEKTFELDKDRRIDVEWNKTGANNNEKRVVTIKIVSLDTQGLLKQMTDTITTNGANIMKADIKTTRDRRGVCVFDVEVRDVQQLNALITALNKLKGMISVQRL